MALWRLMQTNEAAEALADEKLRGFINAHPELTESRRHSHRVMLSPMGKK